MRHTWIIEIDTDGAYMPDELMKLMEAELNQTDLNIVEVAKKPVPMPDNCLNFLTKKTEERARESNLAALTELAEA